MPSASSSIERRSNNSSSPSTQYGTTIRLSPATASGKACRVRTSSRTSTYHITVSAFRYAGMLTSRSVIRRLTESFSG